MLLLQATTTTAQHIGGPSTAYLPVMVFFVFAVAFPVLPLILGRFLRPWKYQKEKMRPYECGIDPLLLRGLAVFDFRCGDDLSVAVGDHLHGL